jgi:hypothetical protein
MRGRDDIVLTSLTASQDGVGGLQFAEAGGYLIQQAEGDQRTVAEVALANGQIRRLAVGSGRYRVTHRASDHLLQGEFEVRPASITEVRQGSMGRIAYAQMVRKGDVGTAMSAVAMGGVRSPFLDVGLGWRVGAGARFDLPYLSLEARLEVGGAAKTNDKGDIDTREVSLSLVGMRAFDVGPLSLGIGLELGGLWFNQRFTFAETNNQFTGFGGPLGTIELPIDRFYARLEVAMPVYLLREQVGTDSSSLGAHVTVRGGLGFGLYF